MIVFPLSAPPWGHEPWTAIPSGTLWSFMIHKSIQKQTFCRLRRFWIATRPCGREIPVAAPCAPPKPSLPDMPAALLLPATMRSACPVRPERPRCRGRFRRRCDKKGRPPHEKHRMCRRTDPAHRVPTVAPEPPIRQQRAPITQKPAPEPLGKWGIRRFGAKWRSRETARRAAPNGPPDVPYVVNETTVWPSDPPKRWRGACRGRSGSHPRRCPRPSRGHGSGGRCPRPLSSFRG